MVSAHASSANVANVNQRGFMLGHDGRIIGDSSEAPRRQGTAIGVT
jgi:hypothetical protein